jgi:SAM-dependent methyltransferase
VRSAAADRDMSYEEAFYPESRFGHFTDVDGTIAFYARVNALLHQVPDAEVLDVGCGRGAYADDPVGFRRDLRILKGKCKRVVGIDVDATGGVDNPFLDEFRAIDGATWPIPDEGVQLALCDSVLEHVDDPGAFFAELGRVVRRGGYVCLRTPNLLSYFGLVSRLVPNRYHPRVAELVQERRRAEDVFPTRYRCNTRRKVARMLNRHGFDPCVYGYEAEPSYLSFSRLAYWLGVMHQRFAPRIARVTLFAFGRKR